MIGGPVSLKFASLNFDKLHRQTAVRWIFEVTEAEPTVRARTRLFWYGLLIAACVDFSQRLA